MKLSQLVIFLIIILFFASYLKVASGEEKKSLHSSYNPRLITITIRRPNCHYNYVCKKGGQKLCPRGWVGRDSHPRTKIEFFDEAVLEISRPETKECGPAVSCSIHIKNTGFYPRDGSVQTTGNACISVEYHPKNLRDVDVELK